MKIDEIERSITIQKFAKSTFINDCPILLKDLNIERPDSFQTLGDLGLTVWMGKIGRGQKAQRFYATSLVDLIAKIESV